MLATYAKLRDGSWGVKLNTENPPQPGTIIKVTKKSGETKEEQLKQIIFKGSGITLASIASGEPTPHGEIIPGREPKAKPGVCYSCGNRCKFPYTECWDCREERLMGY